MLIPSREIRFSWQQKITRQAVCYRVILLHAPLSVRTNGDDAATPNLLPSSAPSRKAWSLIASHSKKLNEQTSLTIETMLP